MKKFIITLLLLASATISNAQLANKNMYLLANLNNHNTGPYSAVEGYTAGGREYAILGCYAGLLL